ncbi:hypothetical protein D3C87_1877590 [compost metagenome]
MQIVPPPPPKKIHLNKVEQSAVSRSVLAGLFVSVVVIVNLIYLYNAIGTLERRPVTSSVLFGGLFVSLIIWYRCSRAKKQILGLKVKDLESKSPHGDSIIH